MEPKIELSETAKILLASKEFEKLLDQIKAKRLAREKESSGKVSGRTLQDIAMSN